MPKPEINHYELSQDYTLDDIIHEVKKRKLPNSDGGAYIHKDSVFCFWQVLADDIEVCIGFPSDLSEWNDEDYILVLDDQFGQPYTPFYSTHRFPFVNNVIGHYNKFMNSINFFKKV